MTQNDADYAALLMERMLDEVKAIHELVADSPRRSDLQAVADEVAELKQDMKMVKAAVSDVSQELRLHTLDKLVHA